MIHNEVVIMEDFEPKIVAFLCNWCAYAGADLAGVSRLQYPSNLRTVRVMCSGRVDPSFVLRAFAAGAVGDSIARAARLFDVTGQLSDESDWQTLLVEWAGQHQLDAIVTPYVPVGPVADLLAAARPKLESRGVRLLQLRRPYDSTAWPHARGGFFKLRKKIPSILEQLGVATSERRVDSKAG